jgi:hypothetical protein
MYFLRTVLALGTVFGLLGLLYFISSRARTRTASRAGAMRAVWPRRIRARGVATEAASLKILRRLNLTSTHQLHLVCATEGTFLVCTHPHGCTLLRGGDTLSAAKREGAAAEPIQRHAS